MARLDLIEEWTPFNEVFFSDLRDLTDDSFKHERVFLKFSVNPLKQSNEMLIVELFNFLA